MQKILLMMIIALALAAAACKDKVMTWTAFEDSPFDVYEGFSEIAYGNGRFVAVSSYGEIVYADWK